VIYLLTISIAALKAKELIFNLYNSGGKKLQKSHFIKVITKILLTVGILGGSIFLYLSSTKSNDKVKVTNNQTLQKQKEKKVIQTKPAEQKNIETGKKFIYENFKNLLNKKDMPVTVNVNMDGTTTAYYKLTKETLINLTLRRPDVEKNSFGGFTGK